MLTVRGPSLIDTNGGTVFCHIVGEGPPLLIPGHASTEIFRELAVHFADSYTVIGSDLRDAGGKTTFPPSPHTVDDLADDLAGVLDALGFERAHYVGLSHTGVLGQGFALRHPNRLDRLALTMTTPGRPAAVFDPAGDAIADRQLAVNAELADQLSSVQQGGTEATRMLAELSYSASWANANPDKVDMTAKELYEPLFNQPVDAGRRFWGALAGFSSVDRLSSITARTLVMTGSGDRMLPLEDAWLLWRKIPRATLVALDSTGHEWYVEAPALGARVVKSFFAGEFDQI